MSRKLFVLVLVAAMCAVAPAYTATWDLYNDFSATSNPNGAWSYGTAASVITPGYTFAALPLSVDFGGGYVGWDDGTTTVLLLNWVSAGKIACSTGVEGSGIACPIVRWTAPTAGTYYFNGTFAQLPERDDLRGDVTYYVLVNGEQVYSRFKPDNYNEPAGYGYEDHSYTSQATLDAGGTIDFAMDPASWYGRDWNTIVSVVSTSPVPEPSAIIALLTGLAGLAGYARKRRA